MSLGFLLLSLDLSVSDTFFEGDILFKDETLTGGSPHMWLQDQSLAWMKGVVPFAFDGLSKFTEAEKLVIQEAMEGIEATTGCIDFVEVDRDEGGDMVLITSRGFRDQPGTGWVHSGYTSLIECLQVLGPPRPAGRTPGSEPGPAELHHQGHRPARTASCPRRCSRT